MQVDSRELPRHAVQQAGFIQFVYRVDEAEFFEDHAHIGAELTDVVFQIGAGIGAAQGIQRVPADVVKRQAAKGRQDQIEIDA